MGFAAFAANCKFFASLQLPALVVYSRALSSPVAANFGRSRPCTG
jgi:hypothetical protein